jgi:hypothetical protein
MAATAGPARGRVSVGHIALAVPIIAAVISGRIPVRDNSYLWHVRAGTLQIDLGRVLTEDPFSFTAAGRAWRTQSWLADLLYGWADRKWGLAVVTPIVVLGALLIVGSIAVRNYRVLRSPFAAAIATTWVMWLLIGYFTPRPVILSLGFLALTLVVADEERLRWALPPLLWLWASIHGGFVVGIGYLVLDGLRRRDRRRIVDVAAVSVVTLLTAHGLGTWQVVLQFLGNGEALDLISEWLTPNLISIELFPFLLGIIAILVGAIRGRVTMSDLWVIVPFLAFAFTANRSVPLAGLVLAPWFVTSLLPLGQKTPSTTRVQGRLNAVIMALVIVVPWLVPIEGGLNEELFAVEAVEHLQPGPAFHDDGVGGYLIYSKWPDRLVYIDDRAELYQDDFIDFSQARGAHDVWREVFARHGIRQALLKHEDRLSHVLRAEGWLPVFEDDRFVVLVAPA